MVGKNYRLQNIQLSKINLGGFAPQTPARRSLTRRSPKARLRSLAKAKGPFRSTEAANIDYVLAWSVRHNSGAQPAEAGKQPSDGRR